MSLASLQPFEMHLLPVAGEQDSGLTSIKRGDMPRLRVSPAHLEPSVHFLLLLRRQPEWLDRSSRPAKPTRTY